MGNHGFFLNKIGFVNATTYGQVSMLFRSVDKFNQMIPKTCRNLNQLFCSANP
jgi:hypothetical protein